MSSFNWPPLIANQIVEYATFADFPSAVTSGNGAFALALNTDILYVSDGSNWLAIAGPGSVLSLGNLDAQAGTAKGAALVAGVLSMQSASATVPGLVNNTTQSLSGNKTFTGTIGASNLSGTNTGDVTLGTANGLSIPGQVLSLALSSMSTTGALSSTDWNTFNGKGSGTVTSVAMTVPSFLSIGGSPITSSGTLALTLSGTALPIANGGTANTTAAAAFNALSPITTTGDMIYSPIGATSQRLAVGSTGNVLTVAGGVPAWAPPATSGTVTSVAMTVPSFLSIAGSPVTSSGTLAVSLSGTALPLANGGTGQTTKAAAFDALSPMTTGGDIIYGGTSGTGTRLANGSANQYLASAGSTSAPVWKSFVAPTQQILTSGTSQTYTLPTSPRNPLYIKVTVIGGGGGGGGGTASSGGAGSGGGGAGGTAIKYISSPSATYIYSVGAATGSAASANNGSTGNASSFDTITANPGGGGVAGGAAGGPGAAGAGGTASGGTININGGDGDPGSIGVVATSIGTGGSGGASSLGGGGSAGYLTNAGQLGKAYGSGGGGGSQSSAGGASAPGIIIVEEYYQ